MTRLNGRQPAPLGGQVVSGGAKPSEQQIGGDHYKTFAIQPAEFIHKNGIGFLEGNIIKYVCRHAKKGGEADLLKARHYVDLLIEWQYHQGREAPHAVEALAPGPRCEDCEE